MDFKSMDYLRNNMPNNYHVSGAEEQSLPSGTMTPTTQAGRHDAQTADTYMMKTKCIICQKRYVSQQEWKTEEEKRTCMKCKVLNDTIQATLKAIETMADEAGLVAKLEFTLIPK